MAAVQRFLPVMSPPRIHGLGRTAVFYALWTWSPMGSFMVMLTLPAFWYVRTTLLSDELGSQLIGPSRYRHLNTSTMLPGGLLRR